MDAGSNTTPTRTIAVCLLGAALLAILPESTTGRLRDLIRSAMQPGQRAVLAIRDYASEQLNGLQSDGLADREESIENLAGRVREAESQSRHLALMVQHLQQQLTDARQHGVSSFAAQTTNPLLSIHAVEARVIGREILAGIAARELLDSGEAAGLREDQWVVDAAGPVVDVGTDHALTSGLPVFAGRCIVGRVAATGKRTSAIQLITAADFRERAIVAGSNGILTSTSPNGLLEGTGHGCRLTQIGATDDIQVGDIVYSLPAFPVQAAMLFGVVKSCTRQPGALHWNIEVEPRADLSNLNTVEIVTPQINPERLAQKH